MTRSVMFKVFSMSMFAMLFTLLFFIQPTAHASNPTNATVGAIRWDAWVGDLNTDGVGAPFVGQQVERSLGPNQYHFRLPFFGVETGVDSVQAREITQTVMDQDIAYAMNAGINYWAFVYYPDNSGMDTGRNLYDSSTHKSDVKYCYILGASSKPSFSWLVTKFGESNYQKVLTNRPLLYIYGETGGYSASEITTLRNLTTAVGLGTPYIVVMGSAGSLDSIGADALSAYVSSGGGGLPYSSLISADMGSWEGKKNTGKKVIPWVTTGWDNRPRYDNPVTWTSAGSNSWVQTATPSEIATNLQNSLNWINSNPTVVEANTVLMYAWNEFDEGGWISPTLYYGTDRLDAIRNVIGSLVIDTTAPAAVMNLAVSAFSNFAILTWTAPGDDGSAGTATSYDIRYSTSAITDANWASATQATGEPAPYVAGRNNSFTVTGLSTSTTYYFALKTSDEVPNVSGLSNAISGTTMAVTTPPSAVTNLSVLSVGSAQLSWTAPGSDGNAGTATSYDIRYSTSAITDANWASAIQATGEPAPAAT